MNFDVVCFGAAFVDVYLQSPDFRVVRGNSSPTEVSICEVYGGKIKVDKMVITTGGGATNVAVGLERLSLQTAVVTAVGDDHWGLYVRKNLQKEGVSPLYIQQVEAPTSYSTILVAQDGGRTALVYRGASNQLKSGHVDWDKLDPQWFYISSLGGDFQLLARIIRAAQKRKIKIAFNPGSQEISARAKLKPFLTHLDLLLLNRQEADSLGKIIGPKMTAITAGRLGAELLIGKTRLREPAVPVKTVEETGAGDAFGSGLVAGLMQGLPPAAALKMGTINGAAVTTVFGPKAGLLFTPEMKRWLGK